MTKFQEEDEYFFLKSRKCRTCKKCLKRRAHSDTVPSDWLTLIVKEEGLNFNPTTTTVKTCAGNSFGEFAVPFIIAYLEQSPHVVNGAVVQREPTVQAFTVSNMRMEAPKKCRQKNTMKKHM
jgi:hypothetical protein